MYSLNARDHFNCSPLLFSWPAPQNRCGQTEVLATKTKQRTCIKLYRNKTKTKNAIKLSRNVWAYSESTGLTPKYFKNVPLPAWIAYSVSTDFSNWVPLKSAKQRFRWRKNDVKLGGRIYIRRRGRTTAVGSAGLADFFSLIFGWRIKFGFGGQIRPRMGLANRKKLILVSSRGIGYWQLTDNGKVQVFYASRDASKQQLSVWKAEQSNRWSCVDLRWSAVFRQTHSEWMSRVIIDHFGDESLHSVTCTGTDKPEQPRDRTSTY